MSVAEGKAQSQDIMLITFIQRLWIKHLRMQDVRGLPRGGATGEERDGESILSRLQKDPMVKELFTTILEMNT